MPVSRRSFFGHTALAGAVIATTTTPKAQAHGPLRANQAYNIRVDAAAAELRKPVPAQVNNGDEAAFATRIGSFSKGLPHNAFGEVTPAAYTTLLNACNSGRFQDFELVTLGASSPAQQRKLVNPMAGEAFDLEGTDSHQLTIRPAPSITSAEGMGEEIELYWTALLRDVPFTDYATHPLAAAAAADLSLMSDFRGPKIGGQVTPATLFRQNTPGDLNGPYISQFLLYRVPFGVQVIDQRVQTQAAGNDFMTNPADWLAIQNGNKPVVSEIWDPVPRYMRNARDLATWVHRDVLYQAYFNAMLLLGQPNDPSLGVTGTGLGCPMNTGNPYNASTKQDAFGTFGPPYFATLVAEVSTRALKAVWHQKWFVHRKLRPEAFGGRIHFHKTGARSYPLHSDMNLSTVWPQVFANWGSYLLPQAFPEGSPIHPSYGAGHATVAGACVTILKALFSENFVLPNPVVPTADGTALVPYVGAPLTAGGELNKLAANIAMGRNMGGVHYRSDAFESLRLGEAVAISVLQNQRLTYREPFTGFNFTKFDGTPVTV